jgi:endoglucanase
VFRPLALALLLPLVAARAEILHRGVNLSAAEFGHYSDTDNSQNQIPGTYGESYLYADDSYFDYFLGQGLNTFRIPFRWERIQPTLGAALDTDELGRLTHIVDYVTTRGGSVILDVHNYARYITPDGIRTLGVEIANADFADLWSRLATEFANEDGVIFGLMNEPHTVGSIDLATERVVSFTNDALVAIRATGAMNLALVQGNGFSGGHSWFQDWYGTPNATAMLDIVDPGDNLAFEVHQYVNNDEDPNTPGEDFATDYSGQTDNVESPTIAAEKLAPFTDWLRENNLRGFLGELGTPDSPDGVAAMSNGINHVEQADDVWLGWAVWAGGPWWDNPETGERYHLSVNPYADGSTAAQLAVLDPFLTPVPEPETWLLAAIGCGLVFLLRRRRARG